MITWYVAYTRFRGEDQAAAHLSRQGFQVYLPKYTKIRRHARRIERVASPLFPRYLFVAMDIEKARWRAIGSTPSMHHLICHGDNPTPVPPEIIEELRAREDDDGLVIMNPAALFKKGEPVRIVQGPLFDRVGLFECASDERRVIILLGLLGRQVGIKVPAEAVVAA